MAHRKYNFSAGPAVLPQPVLEQAQAELLSFRGTGMSIMEVSHRSRHFAPVLESAEAGLRELLNVPENFQILFMQGGASFQFSMVPINFLRACETADYVITGAWGKKALFEAKRCGDASPVYSDEAGGFRSVPARDELAFRPSSRYVHYTSNETIDGVQFKYELDGHGLPVVCDASSDILSKHIDIHKYALIYAGAQKNIGPSGVTVVIIRDDMLAAVPDGLHSMLNYRLMAAYRSMLNTPNTWGIYLIGLVCDWLKAQGGVEAMAARNIKKADLLYSAIDGSDGFYRGHATRDARSLMDVTFRLPSEELDNRFCAEAAAHGMDGLKGHRSAGGIRASIYNAFPLEGVQSLVDLMRDFAERNG